MLPVVPEADMHWWLNYLEQLESGVGRSPDMAHLRALLATTNSRYGAWAWDVGSRNCFSGATAGMRCALQGNDSLISICPCCADLSRQ